jgi:hypothetical protein
MDCCGKCPDGICANYAGTQCNESKDSCGADCGSSACGNWKCETGESPAQCPSDCDRDTCGNNVCEPGENPVACPNDCATTCGDGVCHAPETFQNCPVDCPWCGDGYCTGNQSWSEKETCPEDCS